MQRCRSTPRFMPAIEFTMDNKEVADICGYGLSATHKNCLSAQTPLDLENITPKRVGQ